MGLPIRLQPAQINLLFLRKHLNVPGRRFFTGTASSPGMMAAAVGILMKRYEELKGSKSTSLLKKYLDQETLNKMQQLETPTYKSSFLECIQSGLIHHDSCVGAYAADDESYSTFATFFDKVISDLHYGYDKYAIHPWSDFGDPDQFGSLDKRNRFILSTRMRLVRNIDHFPLTPVMKKRHYQVMEDMIIPKLSKLSGELKGWYFDEERLYECHRRKLVIDHLYAQPTKLIRAAGIGNFYPLGRGFYNTLNRRFSIWMNFEEHMKIVSMQDGSDVTAVYRRLINAINQLKQFFPFMHNEHLGFVTTNPKNLGTGLRASVHIRLVKLPQDMDMFEELLKKHQLVVRGTYGENQLIINHIYDISNKHTLGVTEAESVGHLCKGIAEIISCEKRMGEHARVFLEQIPKKASVPARG